MKKAIAILSVLVVLLVAVPVLGQQGIPIGPGDQDGKTTPIGGLAVLAALGGGYAIKKLRSNKVDK